MRHRLECQPLNGALSPPGLCDSTGGAAGGPSANHCLATRSRGRGGRGSADLRSVEQQWSRQHKQGSLHVHIFMAMLQGIAESGNVERLPAPSLARIAAARNLRELALTQRGAQVAAWCPDLPSNPTLRVAGTDVETAHRRRNECEMGQTTRKRAVRTAGGAHDALRRQLQEANVHADPIRAALLIVGGTSHWQGASGRATARAVPHGGCRSMQVKGQGRGISSSKSPGSLRHQCAAVATSGVVSGAARDVNSSRKTWFKFSASPT